MRFGQRVEHQMQKILAKFMDSPSVKFRFYPLLDEVENKNLFGSLPPSLLSPMNINFNFTTANVGATSLPTKYTENSKDSERIEKNLHQHHEWILSTDEKLADVFPKESFSSVSTFAPGVSC